MPASQWQAEARATTNNAPVGSAGPSGADRTVGAVSEQYEARASAAPPIVHVPVDLVEFEARLALIERRLQEQEDRDRLLLGVAEALRRLTDALGPQLEAVHVPVHQPGPAAAEAQPVSAQRLAVAQARIREAAAPEASELPPPGRRSWMLRALRRMVAQDPEAAGRLVQSLLAAHRLASMEPVTRLPGPPATVARVLVRGRLRRRLGWEFAQLDCELATVSGLAKLVRLRASPVQLHAAGVRIDPRLALALAANSIDPLWTIGHSFALAYRGSDSIVLEVHNGARPSVRSEAPASVTTTVRCPPEALLALLAGEPGVAATVEGERRPLELVQQWFADATGCR